MKNIKRIASLLLALVMVFGLATTASAAMEGTLTGGAITVNNTVNGQTYKAYQIMYLESYDADAEVFTYKANSEWASWLATQQTYVTIDAQGYITWIEGADVAEFAKLAAAQLSGKTVAGSATSNADASSVTISGLNLGYYLVDTTLGSICGLTTTKPTATVNEKNEKPTIEKKVQEDSDNSWGNSNDADIGQTVNFESVINVEAGAINYKFTDTMSAGLTLNQDSIQITVDGTTVPTDGYTLTKNDNGFVINFTNEYIATQVNKQIKITYSAVVNENAVVAGNGNTNTVKLEYGNKPDGSRDETPPVTTVTKTWNVNFFKYTGDSMTGLANAKFTLSKNADGSDPIALVKEANNVYRVAKEGEANTVTEIVTDDTGLFTIKGLDSDTYYLTETAAPAGYNKLAGAIKIEVAKDGAVKANGTATDRVEIENNAGSELPSTGGIGTTIFYTLGFILMAGAAVLLITKKRMSV